MTEKRYRIYLLICLVTHMGYVGQTCQEINKRCHNGKAYKLGTKIRQAFDEHGAENFVCIILEEGLTKEEADERERYWISCFHTIEYGYNKAIGGPGTIGVIPSLETKKRMSENHVDMTGENNPMYGKHHTEETKRKISEAQKGEKSYNYGKHFSDEHKRKIGASQPCKRVQQLTKDGQFVREFSSIAEAARKTGVARSQISQCCSEKPTFVTAGNSVWRYATTIN